MDVETATAWPRTPVSSTIRVRGHEIIQDKPPASGGNDEGPMASELLLASILSCQLSTMARIASKRDAIARVASIRGDLHLDGDDISKVVLSWRFEGGAEGEWATLTRLTDRVCTISRALEVPVEIGYSSA